MTAPANADAVSRRAPRPPDTALHAQLTELQRARLIAATIDTVSVHGYTDLTVAKVIARARVSRRTFYESFSDREDSFVAAFQYATDQLRGLIVEAYAGQPDWRRGIRAGVQQLLMFLDEEPGIARLTIVDALGAGDRVLRLRALLLAEAARAIDAARPSRANPSTICAEAAVGGALAILFNRLAFERDGPLGELLGPLMSMIVLPYLGNRAASRELALRRRAPLKRAIVATTPEDSLKNLQIRVTYRTVRAVRAISEAPGCSNRVLSEHAGITDQGQISKLLSRLESLGLVRNDGHGQPKGAANAWFLTARGEAFERAVRSG
jgi:AcrR family transcriptional regulator